MPAQLVEIPALGVALAGGNAAVLVPGDGPLLLVLDLGKFLFRQDRHRQPAHVQTMVLDAAQINVGADRAGAQHRHEIIGSRHDHDFLADEVEGRVLDGRFPAMQRRPLLVLDDVLHHFLPDPPDQPRVGGGQVGHPDLAVDVGILQRLVLVPHEPFRLLAVFCLQARAGTALRVLAVKHAVPAAQLHNSILLFHTWMQGLPRAIPRQQVCRRFPPGFRWFPANACFWCTFWCTSGVFGRFSAPASLQARRTPRESANGGGGRN